MIFNLLLILLLAQILLLAITTWHFFYVSRINEKILSHDIRLDFYSEKIRVILEHQIETEKRIKKLEELTNV